MNFKDLFSTQSTDYAKYRPTYPKELFDYLAALSPQNETAWDAGTGNGQAAVELATRFKKVIATDPSEKQLSEATQKPNITYLHEKAETPSFTEKVNLITVAQAFHWLNHKEFADACKTHAAPGAHLVVWSYALARITPELDKEILPFYDGLLGPYWEKERKDVEDGYKRIVMPFQEITPPEIEMKTEWTFERYAGYLRTWSALNKFIKAHPEVDLEPHFQKIKNAWGDAPLRTLNWPLNIRVWKI